MDVESLYTNISHCDGLKAYNIILSLDHEESTTPTDFIVQLTKYTLNSNVFLFQDKLYRQIKDKAIKGIQASLWKQTEKGHWQTAWFIETWETGKVQQR